MLETPLLWRTSPLLGTGDRWRFDSQTLARQNLRWYPHRDLTVALEVDEQLLAGESARLLRQAADTYRFARPRFDWTWRVVDEDHVVLEARVDRLWATVFRGAWEATIGRQRIAWGTALVWNPSDLFNPTSPLDFAHVEKPGADGVRLQRHLGPASRLEVAGVLRDPADEGVAAVRLVLNRWEYDWHLLAGRRADRWVAGLAWSGYVGGGGFRGELLGSLPVHDDDPAGDALTAVVSGDYTFDSSLSLHGEVLYDSRGATGDAGGPELLCALREHRLTPARASAFLEVAGQPHPLVRPALSAIVNPHDGSWFAGPTVGWNVRTNLDATLAAQIFGGAAGTEFGDNGTILFSRARWSW